MNRNEQSRGGDSRGGMVPDRCPRLGVSLPVRLYIYSLHGLLTEVLFTALWQFIVAKDFRFHGYSSVWSLPIYSVGLLGTETLYDRLYIRRRPGSVAWPVRGLAYLLWTYSWEFASGCLLRQLAACPWDYTALRFHVHGLIALEFAPLWFVSCLLAEWLIDLLQGTGSSCRLEQLLHPLPSDPPAGGPTPDPATETPQQNGAVPRCCTSSRKRQ